MKAHNTLTHFDERASSWNQLYERPQFKDRLALFVNGITNNVTPHSRILDYGCGTGRIAMELAKLGYEVTGVDGSEGMINKARLDAISQQLTSILFEAINPATWHPAEQQYDAIVCSSVLEYIEEDEHLLKLFGKAVKPGGTLLISVPYTYSILGIIEDILRSCHNRTTRTHDVQFAQRRYSRSGFTNKLKRAGFTSPAWTSFEFPLFKQLGVYLSRIPLFGMMMLANSRRISND